MESTCSVKSARWSQHWVHSKCDQPVIGLHIVVTLGQSFKMGVICNQQAHFGHSGSKHSECAQFLTIAHIVDPLWRTFKMYPIFNHWVHCGQVLSVPTMYSPCAHWIYASLSPVLLFLDFRSISGTIPVGTTYTTTISSDINTIAHPKPPSTPSPLQP